MASCPAGGAFAQPEAAPPDARPLFVRVNPSGYAPAPAATSPRESIDAKLARRTREAEFLFRHICRDCGARSSPAATFDPQAALDPTRRPPTAPAQSSEER